MQQPHKKVSIKTIPRWLRVSLYYSFPDPVQYPNVAFNLKLKKDAKAYVPKLIIPIFKLLETGYLCTTINITMLTFILRNAS